MDATLTVDTSVLSRQLVQLDYATGKQFGPQLVAEESRQFLTTLLRVTPPRTPAQGMRAVARDLQRAMLPLTYRNLKSLFPSAKKDTLKRINQAAQAHNVGAVKAIFSKMPAMRRWKNLNPTNYKEQHRRARNAYGRVTRQKPFFTLYPDDHARYTEKVKSRVGLLKSGWNASLTQLNVRSGGRIATIPTYVSRHGTRWGQFINGLNNPALPSATMVNNAVKYPKYPELVERALRLRQQALTSKLARAVHGKAVNLGFGTLSAESAFGARQLTTPGAVIDVPTY